MNPKRGDRALRPVLGSEWTIRFGGKDAARSWKELSNSKLAPALARLYDILLEDPRWSGDPGRHHRLKGSLSHGAYGGRELERWQHEISGSGRVWFLVDDEDRTVWLVFVSQGHPSATA